MHDKPLERTDAEWKSTLTPEQFDVLRGCGTEPPFANEYWNCHDKGMYLCAGCGAELFSSKDKFESGTGWPSYTKPAGEEAVATTEDNSWMQQRTEVKCARCGGHLGHVFPDGPGKGGQRYCINSAALRLKKKE
ncbi:MAG: peptide-methionine (R)-S-oxide reductase [Candidatus Peregrinibacteria bacterium Greene1014_49]|nr:MAG: peptide-methionine (R)-S-oxide reductase [Candidatus Peregrinibacteria bacterium Greene1014_49]